MAVNNILVPVDFSECSLNALRHAIKIAEQLKSNLIIAHIYPITAGGDATFFMDKSMLETIEKRIRIEFKIIAHYNKKLKQLPVEYVIKMGFVVSDLLDIISDHNIDLVVMGTKGSSNRIQDIFGSNAAEMIRKAHCLIMSIPENAKKLILRKIAIASDFRKNQINRIVSVANLLTTIYPAELKIIHVGDNDNSMNEIKERNEILSAFDKIDNTYDYVSNLNIVKGIEQYIKSQKIDLILLTPHQQNLFDKLFGKSITKKLTLHSQIPLLTVAG